MWQFKYHSVTVLKRDLISARSRVEEELTGVRKFILLKAKGPFLYISYFRGSPPGPFPLTAPFSWPRLDREPLMTVMEVAFSSLSASALYAHYILSARTPEGTVLAPAGRVDLLLGRRIASALPEDHPARHRPPTGIVSPVLFYDEE